MQHAGEKYVTQSPPPSSWLTLIHLYGSGYYRSAKGTIAATRKIVHDITNEIPGLYVLGNPQAVVAIGQRWVLEPKI